MYAGVDLGARAGVGVGARWLSQVLTLPLWGHLTTGISWGCARIGKRRMT